MIEKEEQASGNGNRSNADRFAHGKKRPDLHRTDQGTSL